MNKNQGFFLLIIVGLIPVCIGYLGKLNWIADLFSHFRVIYVLYFLSIGIVALVVNKTKEAVLPIAIAVLLSLSVLNFYGSKPENELPESASLKIASINLLSSNSNYAEVNRFIEEGDFDIVFLLELSPAWKTEIEKLKGYSSQYHLSRTDNFGIGVISKFELDSIQVADLSAIEIPSLLVSTTLNNKELSILATHPLPPIGNKYFQSRNAQFEHIADLILTIENELLVIGDLNSTSFSPNFKRLTKDNNLIDSRLGFGLLPTWNDKFWMNVITLDHALITSGIKVINRSVGTSIGSDHLPIIIEITQ